MIREAEMSALQFVFRHMTRDAIFAGNRADLMILRLRVARLALRIIRCRRGDHRLMRIMARYATDPPVSRIVAFTIGQPVGLEPHVVLIMRTIRRDVGPRSMALPAEVRNLLRAQSRQLPHCGIPCVSGFRLARMLYR